MPTIVKTRLMTRLRGGRLYERLHAARRINKMFTGSRFISAFYKREFAYYWMARFAPKSIRDGDCFFDKSTESVKILGLDLPAIQKLDRQLFWCEASDLLIPYCLERIGRKYEFASIDPIFDEGPYELNERVCVNKGDVVFDLGANIGIFSAIAAKKGASVYSFEPSEKIRRKFTELTSGLYNGISVIPYALGKEKGECMFSVRLDDIASSSLLQNGDCEESINTVYERVNVTTLDDFVEENKIKRVDFIKADIEGAERDMLMGAKRVLKEFHPKLSLCTYHLPDDKEVMERLILEANPDYRIVHKYKKLYAYVD